MSDPVNPRSQRTAVVEMLKEMNVLAKIAAAVGIGLVRGCQTFERGAVVPRRLQIKSVLAQIFHRGGIGSLHMKVVAERGNF